MDSLTCRLTLMPLARRKSTPAARRLLASALDQLDKRAFATALVPDALKAHKNASAANKSRGRWKDLGIARATADLATAMSFAKLLSAQEYTFIVAMAASNVHEGRMFDATYPEIEDISEKMGSVERAHGLEKDQYWGVGDWPPEFERLNTEYELASERRFVEVLLELDANDIAALYMANRQEYERRRERGRRSIFHKDETIASIADAIVRYEREARDAASVKAYTAAVIMLGAAVEGLLLLRCLRSKKKACSVASSLPKKRRPRQPDIPLQWTFDVLIEVCLGAGWLPMVATSVLEIRPDLLAHLLRQMRNNVHPGRVAIDRPWIEVEDQDYAQAEAIYTTIYATTSRGPHLKRLKEAAASLLISKSD